MRREVTIMHHPVDDRPNGVPPIEGFRKTMRLNRRMISAVMSTLLVLFLCLLPRAWMGPEDNIHLIPHADKLVHFGMFFLFAFLWARAAEPGNAFKARLFLIAAAVVLLAIATEWAQGLPIVDRDPDRFDALADTIGGFVGLVLESAARAIQQQRQAFQVAER